MKQIRILMGMPVTVELVDAEALPKHMERAFAWFRKVDELFSTYKTTSEISQINSGTLSRTQASPDVQTILTLAEETKQATSGFFDISHEGKIDPSGIVKGWAIERAADILRATGMKNFYVDAGGDIAAVGFNGNTKPWRVGIRNPFNRQENVKVLAITNHGVATSGSSIRGPHIYNPLTGKPTDNLASLTVIGPNVYEADRFATAAYAMGLEGIHFIEQLPEHEGYMIDYHGQATFTNGFEQFILSV